MTVIEMGTGAFVRLDEVEALLERIKQLEEQLARAYVPVEDGRILEEEYPGFCVDVREGGEWLGVLREKDGWFVHLDDNTRLCRRPSPGEAATLV